MAIHFHASKEWGWHLLVLEMADGRGVAFNASACVRHRHHCRNNVRGPFVSVRSLEGLVGFPGTISHLSVGFPKGSDQPERTLTCLDRRPKRRKEVEEGSGEGA